MSEDLSRYNNSRAEKDLAAIISNDESLLDKIPKSRMEELLIMLYNKCEEQDNKITELNGKLIEYEVFDFKVSTVFPAKSIAYVAQLTPHIPTGKSIVGFSGLTDCSDVFLTFGTSPSFGQYVVRGFNGVSDSAVGITFLKAILFYA